MSAAAAVPVAVAKQLAEGPAGGGPHRGSSSPEASGEHRRPAGSGPGLTPLPDMYLRACELLSVAPADTLAFENSVTGLRCRGGRRGAGGGGTTLYVSEFPADLVVDSLQGPRWPCWPGAEAVDGMMQVAHQAETFGITGIRAMNSSPGAGAA